MSVGHNCTKVLEGGGGEGLHSPKEVWVTVPRNGRISGKRRGLPTVGFVITLPGIDPLGGLEWFCFYVNVWIHGF